MQKFDTCVLHSNKFVAKKIVNPTTIVLNMVTVNLNKIQVKKVFVKYIFSSLNWSVKYEISLRLGFYEIGLSKFCY